MILAKIVGKGYSLGWMIAIYQYKSCVNVSSVQLIYLYNNQISFLFSFHISVFLAMTIRVCGCIGLASRLLYYDSHFGSLTPNDSWSLCLAQSGVVLEFDVYILSVFEDKKYVLHYLICHIYTYQLYLNWVKYFLSLYSIETISPFLPDFYLYHFNNRTPRRIFHLSYRII